MTAPEGPGEGACTDGKPVAEIGWSCSDFLNGPPPLFTLVLYYYK